MMIQYEGELTMADKDYIERSKAMEHRVIVDIGIWSGFVVPVKAIENIPAADVVEVVRCKDCVYHYYAVDCAGMCKLGIGSALLDDDFCSRGIRKDSSNETVI